MGAELEALEAVLGHSFSDRELLTRALTHRSRAFEAAGGEQTAADNEQLEFLGDSILGFLVSEDLIRRCPGDSEGRLSKLKAHLVSATHLYSVAQRLDLGSHLRLGRGEERSGGRQKAALLADALEAVIAAIYLDGGLEQAREFVVGQVVGEFDPSDTAGALAIVDHKSALQEMAQALRLPQPRYSVLKESGPEHSKTFTIEVRLGKHLACQAEGSSKKSAGQRAAHRALEQLMESGA